MNIIIPKFSLNVRLRNALWAMVRGTWVAPYVCHEGQLTLSQDIARQYEGKPWRNDFAEKLFGMQLRGAGYGWESRRNLTPDSDAAIATTGTSGTTNGVDFNVFDIFQIGLVGFYWTVLGTVTAMVMDFDLHPQLYAAGTAVDKLDGSNGVLTGFTVASMAAGNLWYNDIADTKSPIQANPGQSVRAMVTTATSAGNGIPIVIGWPAAETYRNIATAVRMPNT